MAGAFNFNISCAVRKLLCNSYRNLPTRISSIYSISHIAADDDSHVKTAEITRPPKRPTPSYLQYRREIFPFIRNNMPDSNIREINKFIGEKWRKLQPDEKKKYEESYEQEKEKYLLEYSAWRKKLTSDQIMLLKETKGDQMQLNAQKKRSIIIRKFNKNLKQLGKPKRPTNAFILFCQDTKLEHDKSFKAQPAEKKSSWFSWLVKNSEATSSTYTPINWQEVLKTAAEQWRKMSVTEKEPYIKRALKDQEDYKNKMLEWEKNMVQQGKKDQLKMEKINEVKPRRDKKRNSNGKKSKSKPTENIAEE